MGTGISVLIPTAALAVAAWIQDPSLVDAVRSRDANVASMLAGKVDANEAAPDGTTPLHWAVYHGDVDLVRTLIGLGADVHAVNDYGSTPMSEAALVGSTPILESLLEAGADVESPNADGQTALMVVARSGNTDAARLLLDRGADVNAVERFRGQTALMWAAARSQPEMVRELIARGADVGARSMVNGWERQVTGEPRAIYRPAGGLTPLLYAAREGCVECARHLVEAGADLEMTDPEGVTPLIMSVWNAHFDTAGYLLEAGADPNNWDWWGRTPLYLAVDYNTIPHGGRPDQPSLDATTSLEIIEMLIDAGAYPNPQLKLLPPYRSVGADRGADGMLTIGTTPLLRAAKALDAPAIGLLLAAGARPDIPNSRGVLPITAAAGMGSRDGDTRGWLTTSDAEARSIASLALLLDAGDDPNATAGQGGQTLLHGAVTRGWSDLVRFLVARGADINQADSQGLTPLDTALGRAASGRGGPAPVQEATAAVIRELGGVEGTPVEAPPLGPGGRGGRGGGQ